MDANPMGASLVATNPNVTLFAAAVGLLIVMAIAGAIVGLAAAFRAEYARARRALSAAATGAEPTIDGMADPRAPENARQGRAEGAPASPGLRLDARFQERTLAAKPPMDQPARDALDVTTCPDCGRPHAANVLCVIALQHRARLARRDPWGWP